MGANDFRITATGKDARSAFDSAVRAARLESGHGGYSGTIAEKHSFVVIKDTPAQVHARLARRRQSADNLKWFAAQVDTEHVADAIADALITINDKRIDDKWGPAGCIDTGKVDKNGDKIFVFFGWASS